MDLPNKIDFGNIEKLFVEYHHNKNLESIITYIKKEKIYVESSSKFFSRGYENIIGKLSRILPPVASLSILMSLSRILAGRIANLGILEPALILGELATYIKKELVLGQKYIIDLQSDKFAVLVREGKSFKIVLTEDATKVQELTLHYVGMKFQLVAINTELFDIVRPEVDLFAALKRTSKLFEVLARNTFDVARIHVCRLHGKYYCAEFNNISDLLMNCQLYCLMQETPTNFFLKAHIEALGFLGSLKALLGILGKTKN